MSFHVPRTLRSASSRLTQLSQQISTNQLNTAQRRMASTTKYKLNTGATIPAIGFGTWQDKDSQEDAVANALKTGYRHIDGAHIYGTEPQIAAGVKKSGVPREEIFITTKLWNQSHHPEDVEGALDASLRDLQTDYVDLYLMHWPCSFARADPDNMFPKDKDGNTAIGDVDYVDTYKAMEKLQKKGKTKAIGVCNFSQGEMERLIKETSVVPAAHQMEMHPHLQQQGFSDFHQKHGIHVTHYSPFGNQNPIYTTEADKVIEDKTLKEIGQKYGKSAAQVALAWGIQRGHSVIPKSKTPQRIKENLEGDFKLSQEDMDKISKINKPLRFNDPSGSFKWELFSDLEGKKKN